MRRPLPARGRLGRSRFAFFVRFSACPPPPPTTEVPCAVGFQVRFCISPPLPLLLLSLCSVSTPTLSQTVPFQSRSVPPPPCADPPGLPVPLPFFLPSALLLCVSLETGLVAWLPSAAFFFFFFFYEVEIRWHLIDRHGLHGYQGDRALGRDTFSSLGLSDPP